MDSNSIGFESPLLNNLLKHLWPDGLYCVAFSLFVLFRGYFKLLSLPPFGCACILSLLLISHPARTIQTDFIELNSGNLISYVSSCENRFWYGIQFERSVFPGLKRTVSVTLSNGTYTTDATFYMQKIGPDSVKVTTTIGNGIVCSRGVIDLDEVNEAPLIVRMK